MNTQKLVSVFAILLSTLAPAVGYAMTGETDTPEPHNTRAFGSDAIPMDLAAELTEGDYAGPVFHVDRNYRAPVQTTATVVITASAPVYVERCYVTPLLSDVGSVRRCEMVAQ